MNRPIPLLAPIGAAALLLAATVGQAQTPPTTVAPALPRPDLRIEQAILWEYNGFLNRWVVVSGPITSADIEPTIVVRPQQAFRICVRVRNAGGAPAGAFRASGSRLGIWPTPQPFSGLLANQVSEGCVAYPHAPSRPGEYRAIITVDSQQQVSESREDNNAMSVAVRVVQ